MKCVNCGGEVEIGSIQIGLIQDAVGGIRKKLSICKSCFKHKYGEVIDTSVNSRYHGGHKEYLAGGTFSDKEQGQLILTEKQIFFRNKKVFGEGYIIQIPLRKILLEGWSTKEDARLKGFLGGGAGMIVGGMGGILTSVGKSHQIVLPYEDENGIPQAPRFSVGLGKTKKWAKQIYNQIVSNRKEEEKIQKTSVSKESEEDLLVELDERLAKGEVSEDTYKRVRERLEKRKEKETEEIEKEVEKPEEEVETEETEVTIGKCPECGAGLEPESEFCIKCGAKIAEGEEKQEMVRCPECGAELEPDAKFCTECGAKITEEEEEKRPVKKCPNCGSEIEPGAKFCTKCGAKIDGRESNEKVSKMRN